VFLIIIYRKQIILYKKRSLLLAGIVGILVLSPLIPSLLSKEAVTRLKGTSSFREQTVLLSNSIIKLEYDRIRGDKIGEIFDNRRVDYIKTILRGYLVHFSPNWLFITGDLYRHQAPDMGLLYFWEAPFILIGIFQLIRKKARENIFFIGWVLLAPIAASPTTPVPHAIRTLVFLPSFHVFCAMGLISVFSFLYKRSVKWTIPLTVGIVVIIIGYFIYYVHMYFIHTNIEYSRYWYYGYRQAVEYSEAHKGEYKKIVVSTDLEQPYMFFLFFSKYDPNKYLKQGGTVSGNFDEEFNHFDKYEFRKINWQNEKRDGSVLYIGTPDEIAHGTKANIMYLDGSPAIRITDRE
jgi:prepilin-type processing-associated H-X9-DG protein